MSETQPPWPDPPVPDGVADVLLWRQATRVIHAHPPHPTLAGRCDNPQCAHDTYPCTPLRWATRAQHAARAHPPTAAPAPGSAAAAGVAAAPLPRRTPGAALRG